ncbi:hypothetical protein BH24ACT15_BH24ACT15_25960 [soil metagenome]
MRRFVLLLCLLGLAACGDTPGDVLPDARDGRSGLQGSGRIDNTQIAINDGLPEINFGDCDINAGPDQDFCIITEDISGELIVIVFENPDVLVEGATVPVGDTPCVEGRGCDAVTDRALVDLQGGVGDRVRAQSGQVTLDVVVPLSRYRGDLDLKLPGGGTLSTTFDVVPRPDELS